MLSLNFYANGSNQPTTAYQDSASNNLVPFLIDKGFALAPLLPSIGNGAISGWQADTIITQLKNVSHSLSADVSSAKAHALQSGHIEKPESEMSADELASLRASGAAISMFSRDGQTIIVATMPVEQDAAVAETSSHTAQAQDLSTLISFLEQGRNSEWLLETVSAA